MATETQSPGGQPSVALSSIDYPLVIAGTPTWQADEPEQFVPAGPSVATVFSTETDGGGGGAPPVTVPSTGLVWPISGA
jgi:hypothetical protein